MIYFFNNIFKQALFKRLIVLVLLLLTYGCFNSQSITQKNIQKTANNSFKIEDNTKLESKKGNKNYLLNYQDKGRIAFITNYHKESNDDFKKAILQYNYLDEQGYLAFGKITSQALASTIADDNALPYTGSDFERALIHFYSAINYLSLNQYDNSLVEIRAASNIQKMAEAKRQNKVASIENQVQKNIRLSNDLKNKISQMEDIRSQGKRGFLNAYIYYLSGNLRELSGDFNGALVDYKLARQLYPNNSYITEDALRLSANIDSSYHRTLLNNTNQSYLSQLEYNKENTVLVIYEQGFVMPKNAVKSTLWLPSGIYTISLPFYDKNNQVLNKVDITLKNNNKNLISSRAKEVLNTYTMAKNDLSEKYAGYIARQISRGISKHIMQNANKGSEGENPLTDAISILGYVSSWTEFADTRSFRSLPAYVALAKLNTLENVNAINISINNRNVIIDNFSLQNGEIAIVYVVDTGNALYHNIVYKNKK